MPPAHAHFNGSVNLADGETVMRGIVNQHFTQPKSLALQVRALNAVAAAASRPVSFVSVSLPQDQRAESYFAPLSDLPAGADIELNFALVPYHPADQRPGTTEEQIRLIDAALARSRAGARQWGGARSAAGAGQTANRFSACWTSTGRSSLRANDVGNTMPMANGTCMMGKITQSLMNGLRSFNADFAGLLAALTNG